MKSDVIVIGSSASGLVAATTAKRIYKNKDVTIISKQSQTLIPCGIPYVFGSVESTSNNILPAEKMCESMGINIIHEEVSDIDRKNNCVELKNGQKLSYEKLVMGTGSVPSVPHWLKGHDLENVFTIPKNKNYIDNIIPKLSEYKKIVVVGGGFIGAEISDELIKKGKDITLIEKLPHILSLAFDEEFASKVESILEERGLKIIKGNGIKQILGNQKVQQVELENGEKIDADAVILAMGYKPDINLATKANLPMSENGYIKVDEYMRTEDSNIFAVGDCAEKRDFFTRKPSPIMLASTACAEARIAGMNLYKLSAIKTFNGTISIFSTAFGSNGFGVAGLTESMAKKEGFDIVTGVFEGIDRHPGTLADTHKQLIKLIVGKESGIILGGEVFGGLSSGELTNTIGIIIQNRMNLNSLLTAQIGTHPLLTASPAGYPLIKAAENAYDKIISNS